MYVRNPGPDQPNKTRNGACVQRQAVPFFSLELSYGDRSHARSSTPTLSARYFKTRKTAIASPSTTSKYSTRDQIRLPTLLSPSYRTIYPKAHGIEAFSSPCPPRPNTRPSGIARHTHKHVPCVCVRPKHVAEPRPPRKLPRELTIQRAHQHTSRKRQQRTTCTHQFLKPPRSSQHSVHPWPTPPLFHRKTNPAPPSPPPLLQIAKRGNLSCHLQFSSKTP